VAGVLDTTKRTTGVRDHERRVAAMQIFGLSEWMRCPKLSVKLKVVEADGTETGPPAVLYFPG
jgi:hypothetical protein